MKRWFGNFKLELGPLNRFKDVSELNETVALQIHYYNTKRIHAALKTTPAAYAKTIQKSSDKLFFKTVA